jgi:hypothetical protein
MTDANGNDNGPELTIENKRAMSRVIHQYCELDKLHEVYIEFANYPDDLEDDDLIDFSNAFYEAHYELTKRGVLPLNSDPDLP